MSEAIYLTKAEAVRYFNVSRTTIQNWRERGCPMEPDGRLEVGAVTAWKTLRELGAEGARSDSLEDLADVEARLARRRYSIGKRIAEAESLPVSGVVDPVAAKAAVIWALKLEQALLGLPDTVIRTLTEMGNDDLALDLTLRWCIDDALKLDIEEDGKEAEE